MNFEELQQLWDTQNRKPMYIIDERALHNHILAKKQQAFHIARFTEWLLMLVNFAVSGFIVWTNATSKGLVFMYVLAGWLLISTLFVLVARIRRLRDMNKFDRSLLGDLQHALATASYQVRIAQVMRWNILPMALLILLSFWENGISAWVSIVAMIFFGVAYYASGWENNIYKRKKRELEALLRKMEE